MLRLSGFVFLTSSLVNNHNKNYNYYYNDDKNSSWFMKVRSSNLVTILKKKTFDFIT